MSWYHLLVYSQIMQYLLCKIYQYNHVCPLGNNITSVFLSPMGINRANCDFWDWHGSVTFITDINWNIRCDILRRELSIQFIWVRYFINCLVFLITSSAKQWLLPFVLLTELPKLVFFPSAIVPLIKLFLFWLIPHPLSFFITEWQNAPSGIPKVLIRSTRHKSGFIAAC